MNTTSSRILVWDVPTRVFHWLLAGCFAGAYITGDSERWRDVHVLLGYAMLGLIGFRLVWGMIGSRYARFSSFAFGPASITRYLGSLLRGQPEHYTGHNPAGSLAIFGLLVLGVLTGISGYATYNELGGEWLEEVHEICANAMLALVAIHLLGVVVSSHLHGENLARAMLTGRKRGHPEDGITRSHIGLGALLLGAVVAFWYAYPQFNPPATGESTGQMTSEAHGSRHAGHDDDD